MKIDVMLNCATTPRNFDVSACINDIACINVSTMDADHLPSETVKVFSSTGGATKEHWTSTGPVQEVHVGDFIGVCAKADVNSPVTLNSYYVDKIKGDKVITKNAIL